MSRSLVTLLAAFAFTVGLAACDEEEEIETAGGETEVEAEEGEVEVESD